MFKKFLGGVAVVAGVVVAGIVGFKLHRFTVLDGVQGPFTPTGPA